MILYVIACKTLTNGTVQGAREIESSHERSVLSVDTLSDEVVVSCLTACSIIDMYHIKRKRSQHRIEGQKYERKEFFGIIWEQTRNGFE